MMLAPTVTSAQEETDLLRGPSVEATDEKSLVGQGMTGRFERVEGRPEAAALRLLELDEQTRQQAELVVDDRALAVAMLLIERIDDVKEMSDHQIAGRNREAREILQGLHADFDPEIRDPLAAPLGDVLSAEQHDELMRILDEYWTALVDWELRDAGEMSPQRAQRTREATERRLAFQIFQREVREGYEVSLRRYREALDAIYAAVEPTDEQRTAMRDVVIEHIRETKLSATPEQRRATMVRIYALLDEDRQEQYVEYLLRIIVPDA